MKAFTALAVFAALVLGSIAPWSTAQGISAATALNPKSWPPHPSAMWQWLNPVEFQELAPGEEVVLVTVPADSFLVINGGTWSNNTHYLIQLIERSGAGDLMKLHRDLLGPIFGTQAPGTNYAGGYGPMGMTFGPGSQVIVKNTNTGSNPLRLYQTNLFGYFVRD